jgi:hypothetical protein
MRGRGKTKSTNEDSSQLIEKKKKHSQKRLFQIKKKSDRRFYAITHKKKLK